MTFRGIDVATLAHVDGQCTPSRHRSLPHGHRRARHASDQLSLLDWAPRCPSVSVDDLLARFDAESASLKRIEVLIRSLPDVEIDYTEDDAEEMPCTWGECQARGLGVKGAPCPFYRCRHHLGINVSTDGEVQILIAPEQLAEADETCSLAAARRSRLPEEIATRIGLSLGGFELVQRHAWLRAGAVVSRVRDLARGVEMDVEGLPDHRR